MNRFLPCLAFLLGLSFSATGISQVLDASSGLLSRVRTLGPQSKQDPRAQFDIAILHRALELTHSDGPFSLETLDTNLHPLNQSQLFEQTSGWNRIDVAAGMATDQRARYGIPVPVDLTQGMIGQRVLIIRAGEQERFSRIKTLTDLKKLRICIGSDWPDADIMQAAGFSLKKLPQYEALFTSLASKDCDAISRGMHEAPEEIRSWPKLDLALETDLLIRYPARNLFYVHPQRPRLAERLQTGLKKSLENGDFQRLFQLYFDDALSLQQQKRRVFQLDNPFDHPDKPPQAPDLSLLNQTSKATLAPSRPTQTDKAKATPDSLRFLGGEDPKDRRLLYSSELLSHIVRNSEDRFGPIELVEVRPSANLPQQRALASLDAEGLLDVVFSMESNDRNQRYLKIDQSLDHGLLGSRVLLVRAADLPRFRQITSLKQLRQWSVGLGHDWPDVEIMRHNGFQVVTGPSYEGLFNMLPLKRFDFMSRSSLEFVSELKRFPEQEIRWVPGLILNYPAPLRLYVAKSKTALAQRLEYGLQRTKELGQFDTLFNKYHAEALRLLQQYPNPTVLTLTNPLLPADTPLPDLEALLKPANASPR